MSFHQPSVWFLLLLILAPLAVWWGRRPAARPAMSFSTTRRLRRVPRSWAVRLRWIVPVLRAVALGLLVVALARPRLADERTRVQTEGIAIQMVVDRSGSMEATDFELEGRRATRLDVVKEVVEEFLLGSDDLPGRASDLVGLVSFASFADALCPLTFDHPFVVEALKGTEVASQQEGAGTAIGDAIGLGVERLMRLEDRDDLNDGHEIKSRVMILLTDGENNSGDISPMEAAQIANTFDIRIYTIGAGTDRGTIDVTNTVFGQTVRQSIPVRIDERTLKAVANATGGTYFRATDTDSLRRIYAQIDELERTRIEQTRYAEYTEIALRPWHLGGVPLPPLLPAVFLVLCLEFVLAHTRLRQLP